MASTLSTDTAVAREARSDGTTTYLTVSAKRILEGLRSIDLRSFESLPSDTAVPALARVAVPALLQHAGAAARLLVSLPETLGAMPKDTQVVEVEADFEFDLGASGAVDDAQAERDIETALTTLCDSSGERTLDDIEETCGMLAFELRGSQTRLKGARWQRSLWGMLSECDELRKKTEKAARLALTFLEELETKNRRPSDNEVVELHLALAVRELIMGFKDQLQKLTDDRTTLSAETVTERVRGVHRRLMALMRHELFAHLRASDRLQVRQLEQRAEVHAVKGDGGGRDLLADVGAFADLLAEMNQSEAVVRHDRDVRLRCLDQLRAVESTAPLLGAAAWRHVASALGEVTLLRFRDPKLAFDVAGALATPPASADHQQQFIRSAIERLEALRV
jgi:hypothetical protein